MALVEENGYDLKIALSGIVIGCSTSVKFGRARAEKNTTCTDSKGSTESRPGAKSYTMSADGLQRVATGADIATSVTVQTLEKAFEDGTILDFEFGTDTVGATKTSGKCWILSLDKTGGGENDAVFSVAFKVTGSVTDEVNAA
jgi:hypothetical protein